MIKFWGTWRNYVELTKTLKKYWTDIGEIYRFWKFFDLGRNFEKIWKCFMKIVKKQRIYKLERFQKDRLNKF